MGLAQEQRTADLEELAFMEWLKECGCKEPKPLLSMPGHWAAIIPLMFHYSIHGG